MNPVVELYLIVPRVGFAGLCAVVPLPILIPLVPVTARSVDSTRPETISSAVDEILTVAPIPLWDVQ